MRIGGCGAWLGVKLLGYAKRRRKARNPPESSETLPAEAPKNQHKPRIPCSEGFGRIRTRHERYGQSTMSEPQTPFSELAHRRRSNLRIDPERAIDDNLLDQLITTAATAPNHHRTYPWRFRIIRGDGRRGLGNALADHLANKLDHPANKPDHLANKPDPDPALAQARVSKARSKYLRAPVMVVVASRAGEDEIASGENRDAVSAAIQTLLLAATEVGLASLWSTGAAAQSTEVAEFCGFDSTDTIIGLVYLGWPTAELEPALRAVPEVVRIDQA